MSCCRRWRDNAARPLFGRIEKLGDVAPFVVSLSNHERICPSPLIKWERVGERGWLRSGHGLRGPPSALMPRVAVTLLCFAKEKSN